jgi:hypothetical protein
MRRLADDDRRRRRLGLRERVPDMAGVQGADIVAAHGKTSVSGGRGRSGLDAPRGRGNRWRRS